MPKGNVTVVNNSKTGLRNDYIDFLRGIASFGIIIIHTSFWSGQAYTPPWFWNITLILDVPFFFFLSGWAFGNRKASIEITLKSLGKIWCKWCFFIVLLSVVCWMRELFFLNTMNAGIIDAKEFVNNLFFHVSFPDFPVVAGSMWFMPVYFVLIFFNTLICCSLGEKQKVYTKTMLICYISLFLWEYYGNPILGLDLRQYLFYSIFWWEGLNMINKELSENQHKLTTLVRKIILIGLAVFLFNYLQDLPLYDFQAAKFPPSPKYGVISLLSIEIAKYAENRIKPGLIYAFFSRVGKKAIWYFFSQGVGSSLIFYYVRVIDSQNWLLKWLGALGINIIITVIIAELISFLYDRISKCVLNYSVTTVNN